MLLALVSVDSGSGQCSDDQVRCKGGVYRGGGMGVRGVVLFSRLDLALPGVNFSVVPVLSEVVSLPFIHCSSVSGCLDSTKCHPVGE